MAPRAHLGCIAANVAAVTWCWAADLPASATCTCDLEQCFEILQSATAPRRVVDPRDGVSGRAGMAVGAPRRLGALKG
jgi:hypothetical protein